MRARTTLAMVCAALIALVGLAALRDKQSGAADSGRVWHHELAAGADASIGSDTISADFIVDGSFRSHLPLLIIDTHGEEIVNYKYYDSESSSYVYQEGVDPYLPVEITLIDNENYVNQLSDEPKLSSRAKIKVRGNFSSTDTFPKKQFLIKLLTGDGDKNAQEMIGMTASDTWILNGTQRDRSYLRNYIAMNTAGEIEPYTPDIRFCEMVLKSEEGYLYMGLYGLYEKVERGEGRVEIQSASTGGDAALSSYILLRDRRDVTGYSMPVWATAHETEEHKANTNWINLEYPSSDKVTEAYWDSIQAEIETIERALYADNDADFIRYRSLLDVDSFVDYFIINEFFSNYDAGWNSTFMYKDVNTKLKIGAFWDYDGAMDNFSETCLDIKEIVFSQSPWFDRLVQDPYFVDKVEKRYRQLRQSILSTETIQEKIEGASAFLEKPIRRDRCRWQGQYKLLLEDTAEADTGLTIYRNKESWEEEVQRLEDVILLHGEYLDSDLAIKLIQQEKNRTPTYSVGGWLMIAVFFVSVILVQRWRKGL